MYNVRGYSTLIVRHVFVYVTWLYDATWQSKHLLTLVHLNIVYKHTRIWKL